MVETFGTGKVPDGELEAWIDGHLDLRPAAIISRLDLRRPIYSGTAAYGHFGKENLSWEQLDDRLISSLKALLN